MHKHSLSAKESVQVFSRNDATYSFIHIDSCCVLAGKPLLIAAATTSEKQIYIEVRNLDLNCKNTFVVGNTPVDRHTRRLEKNGRVSPQFFSHIYACLPGHALSTLPLLIYG